MAMLQAEFYRKEGAIEVIYDISYIHTVYRVIEFFA
jgi:hypothetical protein